MDANTAAMLTSINEAIRSQNVSIGDVLSALTESDARSEQTISTWDFDDGRIYWFEKVQDAKVTCPNCETEFVP